jgi:hypothetical protein
MGVRGEWLQQLKRVSLTSKKPSYFSRKRSKKRYSAPHKVVSPSISKLLMKSEGPDIFPWRLVSPKRAKKDALYRFNEVKRKQSIYLIISE